MSFRIGGLNFLRNSWNETVNLQQKYQRLVELARQIKTLQSASAVLEWDQQTMMPAAGADHRANQITLLAAEVHRRQTDPELAELLNELASTELAADPHGDSGSTIVLLKREIEKQSRIPVDLVQRLAHASSRSQQIWVQARKQNDFSMFAPCLREMFQLKREQADAVGYEECRYDALLDDFEPFAKTSEVANLLGRLKEDLVPLIREIAESEHQVDDQLLWRTFPIPQQAELARWAAEQIGFDFNRGRMDTTHHPFCTELGPNDTRITTRYYEDYFNPAFFGTLHEAGHGIYDQGLPTEFYGLPAGSYCSLGVHESQSRFWENVVGRSRGFWDFVFPKAQSTFPESWSDATAEQVHAAVNKVQPSLIRVEADEATYNLHVIIRFELEQQLLNDQLSVDDLPDAWNQQYETLLGVRPDSDANGVLQDIHWSAGLVGYFSTYSLGNLFAAQLVDAMTADLGNIDDCCRQGEFDQLKSWMNEKIHRHGARWPGSELIRRATGKPLDHRPLVRQLRNKLGPLYGLDR